MKQEHIEIFISHSKELGNELSVKLKDFLKELYPNKLTVHISPNNSAFGVNWFDDITTKLTDSQIMICLVDDQFQDSPWGLFEVGYYYSLKNEKYTNKCLLPILINDYYSESSPIWTLGSREFGIEVFIELVKHIEKLIGNDASDGVDRLRKKFEDFRDQVFRIEQKYTGDSDEIIDQSLNIPQERALYLVDELLKDIRKQLRTTVIKYYKRKLRASIKNKKFLGQVFISYPIRLLKYLNSVFEGAAIGSIRISNVNFFESMWNDEIIENVQSSIWTTNTRGSNARKLDQNYINSQKELIDDQVEITRIFIIHPSESSSELKTLCEVLKQQLQIGINVGVILQKDYDLFLDEIAASVGGADFMLLDKKFVFVTHTDKKRNTILRVDLLDNDRVMGAIKLSKKIQQSRENTMFKTEKQISNYFDSKITE